MWKTHFMRLYIQAVAQPPLIFLQTLWRWELLFYISEVLCYWHVWRVLTSHCWGFTLKSLFGSAACLGCRASGQHVLFLLVCQSCHFCLIVQFPRNSSPVPLHVPLSSKFSLHLSPLSSAPSQDKQPLFWGMSAICSKELIRSWMLISSGSLMGGKLSKFCVFTFFFCCTFSYNFFHRFSLKHTEILIKNSHLTPSVAFSACSLSLSSD